MKTTLLNDVIEYLEFLRTDCGLSVTLHLHPRHPLREEHPLTPYSQHRNPFCLLVKNCAWRECVRQQARICKTAAVRGEYCSMCYAGISEWIFPIVTDGEVPLYVAAGGYREHNSAKALARIRQFCTEHALPEKQLLSLFYEKTQPLVQVSEIRRLVRPLVHMLTLYWKAEGGSIRLGEAEMNDDFSKVVYYVKLHRTEPLTAEQLARQFYCSASRITHLFRRKTGYSLNEYLCRLRMEDAEVLVGQTTLPIQEIAAECGYTTAAYFSSSFHRHTGFSPLEYRRRYAQEQASRVAHDTAGPDWGSIQESRTKQNEN